MHLATTPSREVAWSLKSASSEGGVGCTLRVGIRPECPEDYLRELTVR